MEEHVTECNQSCDFRSKIKLMSFLVSQSILILIASFVSKIDLEWPGLTCHYSAGENITVIPSKN